VTPHTLPSRLFHALSRGAGGAEAVRVLAAAERSKHLLLLHGLVAEAGHRTGAAAESAQAGYDHLARLAGTAPQAAEQVLCYPAVGLWALTSLRALRAGDLDAARPERIAALALAVAARAGEDLTLTLFTEGETVTVPSVAGMSLPGMPDRTPVPVRAREGRVELASREHGRSVVREVRRLGFGSGSWRWQVALDDVDPYRFPSGAGARYRLGADELAQWRDRLGASWDLLTGDLPRAAEEVRAAVRVLTPIASTGPGESSASSGALFGGVALSTPAPAASAAVTLVHETQHLKLNALMTMFDLTAPVPGEVFYAPWRSDPRPFTGLFHGAYAHLGVAAFWRHRRGRDPEAAARFAFWRRVTLDALRTLLSAGRFTARGRQFAEGMLEVLEGWEREPVPAAALAWARAKADLHRARWLARHPAIAAGPGR
jgi:HEXXH motif-containing protein